MIAAKLKKLATTVRQNDQPTSVPGFLRPIDTDQLARAFDIDRTATERGTHEQPSSSAENLDSVEQTIVQKVESEWAWQGGELTNQLRAYAARLLEYSIQAEFQRLQLRGNNAIARLRNANHQAEALLGPLREAFTEARDELNRFRSRHRLDRPARRVPRRWTTFGLMFVLIAIESILNGFFFAKGAQFGLVGGVGTAVGISIVNVIFTFLVGLGPARLINHRNALARLSGLVLTVVSVIATIALHAFAAHYREATALAGDDNAMADAIATLKMAPWSISDLSSVYLFSLGMLFGVGSLWKGYTFDDPYPWYGAVSRRYSDAREAYSDEHLALFDELEGIKEETVQAIDDGIGRIPKFPQNASNIRAKRAALLQSFRGYETSVETAANQLLARYRDGNVRARTTPSPAHFARLWLLPYSFLESAEIMTLTTEALETKIDLDTILSDLRALTKGVLVEYETLLANYPHPTQML